MKRNLQNILIARDNKTRIAKSLVFGALLSLIVGYYTSEVSYSVGKRVVSEQSYDNMDESVKMRYSKKTKYQSLIILIVFVFGAGLSYSVIREGSTPTNKES
tara:strand:+ start:808 stop:1113 length:306 start_codon:yes stop_codon:yes gene_type:complete